MAEALGSDNQQETGARSRLVGLRRCTPPRWALWSTPSVVRGQHPIEALQEVPVAVENAHACL